MIKKTILITFLLASNYLFAEDSDSDFFNKNIEKVELYHKNISDIISDSAEYVDSLWYKDRNDEDYEINRSYGIFDTGLSYSSKEGTDYKVKMKLKYHLPNMQNNFNLFLDINDDDQSISNQPVIINEDSKEQLSSGIVYENEKGQWTRKHRIGVKFSSPLNTFIKSEIFRTKELSRDLSLLMKQDVFYYKVEGLGTSSNLDFLYTLKGHDYLQASYKLQYLKKEQWEFFSNYSYFHSINENNSLKYSIGAVSENINNTDVIRYWANVRFRHLLYDNWLFLKLTPEISFSEEYNYEKDYRFLAEFQVFLGSKKGIRYSSKKYQHQ